MKLEHNYFRLPKESDLFPLIKVGTCFEVMRNHHGLLTVNQITPNLSQLAISTEVQDGEKNITRFLIQLGVIDSEVSKSVPIDLEVCTLEDFLNYLDKTRKECQKI